LHRNKGRGAALLEHRLRQCDREHLPAYLWSSNPLNISLYQRHGFEIAGTIRVGSSPSIYFKDPNGLSLEYCCVVGNRPEGDAMMQGRFTVSRAALELTDALNKARSTGDKAKTGV
jgi:ribosomal protein S18 acetylase RimI-like enzyme